MGCVLGCDYALGTQFAFQEEKTKMNQEAFLRSSGPPAFPQGWGLIFAEPNSALFGILQGYFVHRPVSTMSTLPRKMFKIYDNQYRIGHWWGVMWTEPDTGLFLGKTFSKQHVFTNELDHDCNWIPLCQEMTYEREGSDSFSNNVQMIFGQCRMRICEMSERNHLKSIFSRSPRVASQKKLT